MAKKPIVQGGVDNYLGDQPQVVAPRKWQSSPDAPPTELAYITKAEKDLILKKDIHGSLSKGPNMGPSGIMSLDSFGDIGGAGASGGDTSASGGANEGAGFSGQAPGQSDRDFDRQKANERAALQIAERAQARNLGYDERANIANRTYGPLQKYTGRSRLFGGANRYGYTDVLPDGSLKPGYGGRIFGGLMSLLTGIPFVGGAIGTAYDYGKGIFGRKPKDMSEYNRLGLFGIPEGTLDEDEDEKISETSFTLNDPNNINNQITNINRPLDNRITQNVTEGPYSNIQDYLETDLTTNTGIVNTDAFTNSNFGLGPYDG